jgi:hypothetical protein
MGSELAATGATDADGATATDAALDGLLLA